MIMTYTSFQPYHLLTHTHRGTYRMLDQANNKKISEMTDAELQQRKLPTEIFKIHQPDIIQTLNDIKKNEVFQKNGFSIIRVREEPLEKIGGQDVIVSDRLFESKRDVGLLFKSLLKEYGKHLDTSKEEKIDAYINSSDFVNDDLYNLYLS